MNLFSAHYLVLAIIMVSQSGVNPFPFTETKSWIRSHKASTSSSSFGGECPDCLSQEEASLRLPLNNNNALLLDSNNSSSSREKKKKQDSIEMMVASAGSSSSLQQEGQESTLTTLDAAEESPLLSSSSRRRRKRSSSSGAEAAAYSLLLSSFSSSSSSSSSLRSHQPGDLKIVKRGARSTSACLAEREERLRLAQSTQSTEYIPNCRRDGSYAHVQCHPSTRSCWCVTRNGRPIPGSSVLSSDPHVMARPSCAKYNRRAKSQTRRRSSQFRKNRKSCNQADWSRFNMALLKTFRSEYNRYRLLTSSNSDLEATPSDTIVLGWKFDHLDRSKDMVLQRNETNILKNLVRQQIQPRSCAKNFIASCSNGDQQITKSEWLDCLRVSSDINLPFDTFNSLVDSSTSRGMHPSLLLKPVSSSSTSGSGSSSLELTPPLLSSGTVGETTEQSNCWTDRQSALASQKQNESIIIPECTANGNYRKVQCAQVLLTGKAYCWCVEEESGVQIPNTVVFNTTPDCNNRYSKPMKGCAGGKKHKFLMDLFSTLKSRMLEATRDGGRRGQGDRNMSPEELASRWYFTELDVNTNGVLDRKEWKTFRNETSQDKRLKKCGKKLPRHCDVNQDKKITMTEWLDCLGVKFLGRVPTQSSGKRPVNRSHGPRSGKNPFTTILKQRR